MNDIKDSENKSNLNQTSNKNNENLNTFLFDKTLRQIENALENLGEKIESKNNIKTNEATNKETFYKDEHVINKSNLEIEDEHIIDGSHLRMESLHKFNSPSTIEKKKIFGFYTYLALLIGIIFGIYEILNTTKDLIILKFPISEPYIEYFYEVIEILAYSVMNIISLIKGLF
jgi:hypothetical protein